MTILKLQVSPDKMLVYVAKGTSLAREVASWKGTHLVDELKAHGFRGEILKSGWEPLKMAASRGMTDVDIPLLKGILPSSGSLGYLVVLLPEKKVPPDHAVEGGLVAKVIPSSPGRQGVNVYGEGVFGEEGEIEEFIPKFDARYFEIVDDFIVAKKNGQFEVKGEWVIFKEQYTVEDCSLDCYNDVEFYCPVVVEHDLANIKKWVIRGNLTVKGMIKTPFVKIYGNLIVGDGIQTSSDIQIQIQGVCRTNYIHYSNIFVGGNLFIESGVVLSSLDVRGNFQCTGDPGAILGSYLLIGGSAFINRLGSESGKSSHFIVKIPQEEGEGKSSSLKLKQQKIEIKQVMRGTQMAVGDTVWIQQESDSFIFPKK